MQTTGEITIRPYVEGDEAEIVACYNRIFPDPVAGIGERSRAHWLWKFRDNPARRMLHMLGVHASEGVIGIYAGIPVRIWSEEKEQLAAQGVDLCVEKQWRRYGGGPGLFAELGRHYIDRWHGCGSDDVLFTYGLPVPAWRSGKRYLDWMNIRDWDITFRELPAGATLRSTPAALETKRIERFSADVDALFARIRPSIGLAIVRDSAYLNWRYADCPDREYALYECRERDSGRLRGVCVYGISDVVRARTGFLVDWLHQEGDTDVMVSMLGAVEERALRDRVGVLGSVWNHVDPRFLSMQNLGYRVRGTRYFLVLATPKYETQFFRDNWYFTMGDTDLV